MSYTSSNNILLQAYEYVNEHDRFLRLTTISTIVHSMIFIVIVGYNVINILGEVQHTRSSTVMGELTQIAQQLSHTDGIIGRGIIAAIILAVGYYILPPIGEASMIYYLEKTLGQSGSTESSISHGLKKFFVMFERNSILTFISVSSRLTIISRIWMLDIIEEPIIIPTLIIYTIIVLGTVVLTPYVKFKLVIESDSFITAIKESVLLTISNPGLTLRLVLVGLVLNLRIIFNIIVIVGVPAILFYLASLGDLHETTLFYIILTIVFVTLFLLIAYINSIIEAFFMTYRYLGYRALILK